MNAARTWTVELDPGYARDLGARIPEGTALPVVLTVLAIVTDASDPRLPEGTVAVLDGPPGYRWATPLCIQEVGQRVRDGARGFQQRLGEGDGSASLSPEVHRHHAPAVVALDEAGVDLAGTFVEAKARANERFEAAYLEALLSRCEGNLSKAAREAGTARNHLRALLKKHGLHDPGLHFGRDQQRTLCGKPRTRCSTENAALFRDVKAGRMLSWFREVCTLCDAELEHAPAAAAGGGG